MLIPDVECLPRFSGVACDVLIFPDSDGNLSDALYQHQAYIQKHLISNGKITPSILKSFHTEHVACYTSGSEVHPFWLWHSINEMIEQNAIALIKSKKTDGAYTSTHKFPVHIYSRDLFIEKLLLDKSKFFGKAMYSSQHEPPDSPKVSMTIPHSSVECDVLVPFFSTKYLRETLDSLVIQNNARCIIHAIDDNPGQEYGDLIEDFPQVRWYRNKENIGQFMSVNNIVDRCDTDFLVINDADDLADPNRMWLAITAMELGSADVYGSQVTQFLEENDPGIEYHHVSVRPDHDAIHPLVHGTMVVRKSEFIRLGGYADFGNVDENKCGNDTEFMLRAYWSGSRFHIGQSRLMRIRLHQSSCVNNFPDESIARSWTMRKTRIRQDVYERPFDPTAYGGGFDNWQMTDRIEC